MARGPALRPQDLGLGLLFWRTADAVVGADVEAGRIVLWNRAAERLFGYPEDEAIGMPLEWLVPPAWRDAHLGGIARYLATGHGAIIDGGRPVEVTALRKDGEEVPVELTLTPATGAASGRFVVAIARDLSERRRTEAERHRRLLEEAARAEAEAAVRTMDEVVGVAAHELKTPLASVRGSAQLLLHRLERGGAPDEEVRRALERIDRQSARLARVIEQLLDAAQLQAGSFAIERQDADLAVVVRRAVRAVGAATGAAIVEGGPEALPAWIDAPRVGTTVTNLIENAVRHSPEAESVEVELAVERGVARIVVRDRGPGVAPARREAIFERFHVGRSDYYGGGLGLGLHVGRRIAELHGGGLEAEFPPEGGARFVLTLPIGGGGGATGGG